MGFLIQALGHKKNGRPNRKASHYLIFSFRVNQLLSSTSPNWHVRVLKFHSVPWKCGLAGPYSEAFSSNSLAARRLLSMPGMTAQTRNIPATAKTATSTSADISFLFYLFPSSWDMVSARRGACVEAMLTLCNNQITGVRS